MRTLGSNGEETRGAIRAAAVAVIAKHGFQAASLRMIAKEVGIRAPSLYNYIKSKGLLLFDLLHEPLVLMIAQYGERTKGIDDPFQRLRAYISVHLDFHLNFRPEVFIGNMELRSLSKAQYKIITGLRDDYSHLLTQIIKDGARSGVFKVEDSRVATFALLAMLTGVCNWFRPDGRIDTDKIIKIHTDLAFRMLGIDPEAVPEPTLPTLASGAAVGVRTAAGARPAKTAPRKSVKAARATRS